MAHMHKWDPDAMGWIPHEQPFSRPKPRQVNRHMLLRGLAEEVVYEDSVAQRYAGLLAAVICDGNPTAKREYEHMLAQERQRAKSFGTNRVCVESAAFGAAAYARRPQSPDVCVEWNQDGHSRTKNACSGEDAR
jgi:hypothetical protein